MPLINLVGYVYDGTTEDQSDDFVRCVTYIALFSGVVKRFGIYASSTGNIKMFLVNIYAKYIFL